MKRIATGAFLALIMLAGCIEQPALTPQPAALRDAAVEVIAPLLSSPVEPIADSSMRPEAIAKAMQAQYQFRALALEIIAMFPQIAQPVWLERGLDSPHDGVHFAALSAVARLCRHDSARFGRPFSARVRQSLEDKVLDEATGRLVPRNPFIHLVAGYAHYRITGNAESIAFMPDYLAGRVVLPLSKSLTPAEQADMLARLRAETIYVLSLMPELSPQPLIESARKDTHPLVAAMAHNRLAVLGDSESLGMVLNMVRSPRPDEALGALATLEEIKLSDLNPLRVLLERRPTGGMFRQGWQWLISVPPEVRVAAARALAFQGDRAGLQLALDWLDFTQNRHVPADERLPAHLLTEDPLYEHRVRFISALALGAIGDYDRAAEPLLNIMKTSPSMRFRLTAARASMELLERSGRWAR